ncbi:MAG: exo-alpha-sialidase [Bacteroidetes bacterium]|nr:MAG: exo-alpha-sialidase [Bacteroidota bacterium]
MNSQLVRTLVFTFSFFGILQYSLAQNTLNWSSPQAVVSGNSYGNLRPRAVLNGSGQVVVMWGQLGQKTQYSSVRNGNVFTAPRRIPPVGMNIFTSDWAGPDMASSGDTIFIVYKEQPEDTSHVYISRSLDGGLNFQTPVAVDNIADSLSRFPAVAVKPGGNPVVSFMKFDPMFGDPRYVVTNSSDGGLTFSADVHASVHSGGEACDCCTASMLANSKYQVVQYRDNLNNLRNIWAAASTDDGITFTLGVPIDQTGWIVNACPSSGPDAVLFGDSLYTVWMSRSSGKSLVYFSGVDLTNGFLYNLDITGDFAGLSQQNYPRIDKKGDRVAVVWQQNAAGSSQIVVAYSMQGFSNLFNAYEVVAFEPGTGLSNTDVVLDDYGIHVFWSHFNSGEVRYSYAPFTATSISESQKTTEHLLAYPVSSGLMIQAAANEKILQVNLFDLSGRKIKESRVHNSNKFLFPIDKNVSGLHVLEVYGPGTVQRLRVFLPISR